MKKTFTLLAISICAFIPQLTKAQNIFSGERVQIVGSFQSYITTPYGTDYRTTTFRRVAATTGTPTDGRGQWTSTINVKTTGGDVTPVNMPGGGGNGFLFISGPVATPFQNKWVFGGIGQASINGINDLIYNGSTDMGLNMSTEGFYTFVMNDCGYNTNVNAKFYIGRTTNAPVTVSRASEVVNPDGSITININTSGIRSAEENILVRYVSGISSDFSGSTATNIIQATGTGTSFVATIPAPTSSTSIKYYVFTSTINATSLNTQAEINKSLATLRYDDNSGANYTTAITLPVQLSAFAGNIQNNAVQLEWKTSSEKEVEKFEIEKLNNKWTNIGSVQAANTSNGSAYTFKDANIQSKNTYRLKIIDKSGSISYSNTLSINADIITNSNFKLFPTVVVDKNIQVVLTQKKAEKIQISVVDAFGKRISTQQITTVEGVNNFSFTLPSNITKGRYFVQVNTSTFNKTSSVIVL